MQNNNTIMHYVNLISKHRQYSLFRMLPKEKGCRRAQHRLAFFKPWSLPQLSRDPGGELRASARGPERRAAEVCGMPCARLFTKGEKGGESCQPMKATDIRGSNPKALFTGT